ncbi:MAG: dihydrolipoyl dehydrogenase [Mycoplasmataceae bacterium]|nr:dihydrolipoyl dehydrogenase [Mycoplasmataceae bacterium]
MFDLIIIGAGPGGYHLAEKAAKENKKVAIIEKDKFGGTCLNVGCIPSKAFLHVEKIVEDANRGREIGVVGPELTIDQKKVVDYKNKKVDFLCKATKNQVRKSGAKIYDGYGKIVKPTISGLFSVEVNDEIINGKNLVIATGSLPFVPPIKGVMEAYNDGDAITSTEALSLTEIPKRLLVVGAGVIGLELGSYFSGAGSKVTVVELGSKIAGPTDTEISTRLENALKQKGMNFILNSSVIEVEKNYATIIDKENKKSIIPFDKILIAAGRKPYIENLGLENIGVFVERNTIIVDDKLQTNIPGVYAVGDVNGKLMLAHTAMYESEVVLDNINNKKTKIDYNKIPTVIYGSPEVAEIGITEDKAKLENMDVTIKKISMLYSGRFVIENELFEGLFKVVINNKTKEIIGLSIFGNYASEIIIAGSILVGKRFNVEQIKNIVFAHPTVGEIIKNVLFN